MINGIKKVFFFLLITTGISFFISCHTTESNEDSIQAYYSEIENWRKERSEKLKSPNGWLNLVGLYQINEGINEFGSHPDNTIIFPEEAPEFMGAVIKVRDQLSISINDSIDVYVGDSLITDLPVKTDKDGEATIFKHENFKWHFIFRNGKYALRLRDTESPKIDSFNEIPCFQTDTAWRIPAEFKPFDSPVPLFITDVTGAERNMNCYGVLNFSLDGKKFELHPVGNGVNEDFLLMFGDLTNTKETYGGGRYVRVLKPNKNGVTFIDFNKAYNPPCAFTEFATCPLPPEKNMLEIRITAGEKSIKELK